MHTENLEEFIAPGEPLEIAKWRRRVISRCRWFSDTLWSYWLSIYLERGYVQANLWLSPIEERLKLGSTGLKIDAGDEEILEYAKAKTKNLELDLRDAIARFDKRTALNFYKQRVLEIGVPFPLDDKAWNESYDVDEIVSKIARTLSPHWLAKKLRNITTRELEQLAREIQLVHRGRNVYISEFSLRRLLWRKNANRKLLENLIAENDLGQVFSLAELSDLGVSNPINRRNELMERLSGFEQWAEEDRQDWQPMFYTITTPSKFHPISTFNGKYRSNPKYNGSSPEDAQKYLTTLWAQVRAKLKRDNIEFFGFRVAEPHHDGTPHWHLLLFVKHNQEPILTSTIKNYALKEDGDEPGAKEHRFEAVKIDPSKGRATGYIAKYVAKNIDGYKTDYDYESQQDASISAIRAACWASLWGIRQFQQLGGPPVTVWRELRRLDQEALEVQLPTLSDQQQTILAKAFDAADTGNWSDFTECMGGAVCLRKSLAIRAHHVLKGTKGKYGEDIRALFGLSVIQGTPIQTRLRTWTITLKSPNRVDVTGSGPGMNGPPPGQLTGSHYPVETGCLPGRTGLHPVR